MLWVMTSHTRWYFCVGSYPLSVLLFSVQNSFCFRHALMSSHLLKCITSIISQSNVLDWFIIHDSAMFVLMLQNTMPSQTSNSSAVVGQNTCPRVPPPVLHSKCIHVGVPRYILVVSHPCVTIYS